MPKTKDEIAMLVDKGTARYFDKNNMWEWIREYVTECLGDTDEMTDEDWESIDQTFAEKQQTFFWGFETTKDIIDEPNPGNEEVTST